MVAPVVKQVNMAAPGALNTDVILTDPQTGFTFLLLNQGNRIVDITNAADPAAGLLYLLKLVRNGREVRRWTAAMFLTTVNVHVGFPVDLIQGQIQFVGQQTLGALTAQNYMVTFATDL